MVSTIIILIITVVFVVMGFRRGVARTLLNFAAMIADSILSHFLASLIAQGVYDAFIKQTVMNNLERFVAEQGVDYAVKNSFNALPDGLRSIISGFVGLFGASSQDIQGRITGETTGSIVRALEQPVNEMTVFLLSAIITVLLFILFWILFKAIIRKALIVFRIPVIKQVNMLLGGVLGLLEAAVFLLFAVNLLYVLIACTNPSVLDNSALFGGLFNWLLIIK